MGVSSVLTGIIVSPFATGNSRRPSLSSEAVQVEAQRTGREVLLLPWRRGALKSRRSSANRFGDYDKTREIYTCRRAWPRWSPAVRMEKEQQARYSVTRPIRVSWDSFTWSDPFPCVSASRVAEVAATRRSRLLWAFHRHLVTAPDATVDVRPGFPGRGAAILARQAGDVLHDLESGRVADRA